MFQMTHYAKVVSSGQYVPVQRIGRLLIVFRCFRGGSACVSTFRYDKRFKLLRREGGAQ